MQMLTSTISPSNCSICNSKELRFRLIEVPEHAFTLPRILQPLHLNICENCGHAIRIEDRCLEQNHNIQTAIFDNNVFPPDRRQTRWPHRPALVSREVRRLVGNNGKTLDIGCNTGVWLATLGNNWEKYGVELSPLAADTARLFSKAKVYCGSIESYDQEEDFFDLITAFAVIEHLTDPRFLVTWAYQHLKPGGVLLLMTGDRESNTAQEMGANWPLYAPKEHVSFFSSRSLIHLVEHAGFKIVRNEWRFMYTASGFGSVLYRLLQKAKEITGFITGPQHDHYFLYARKPN